MTFFPDGQPKIPNQTPIPHVRSVMDVTDGASGALPDAAPADPRAERQRAQNRTFIRLAIINGIILAAAVVVGYVLHLPSEENAVWVVFGAALLTGVHTAVVVLGLARGNAAHAGNAGSAGARTGGAPPATSPASVSDAVVQDAPVEGVHDHGYSPGYGTPSIQDVPSTSEFSMPIEDVFSITGRGTIATGRVTHGQLHVGQQVRVLRGDHVVATTTVQAIEAFRRKEKVASTGDNVGLLLADVRREDLSRGDVVVL